VATCAPRSSAGLPDNVDPCYLKRHLGDLGRIAGKSPEAVRIFYYDAVDAAPQQEREARESYLSQVEDLPDASVASRKPSTCGSPWTRSRRR
jgi:hypothetical protein